MWSSCALSFLSERRKYQAGSTLARDGCRVPSKADRSGEADLALDRKEQLSVHDECREAVERVMILHVHTRTDLRLR